MKKRMTILVALLTILCLFLSGCAQANDAASAEEISEPAIREPEEQSEITTEEEEYFELDDDVEVEVYEPEMAPDTGMYLDLDGMAIVAMAPFEGGIGWIQYMRSGEMYTAAVELDGHVLFEIPGPVWYVSPFEDGAAYVVISENATYYSNANPSLGCYEQVAPAITHEVIFDVYGNELYTTSSTQTSTSTKEEHILCAGDGKYVVLRHESGLEYNGWALGTIDKFGNIIDDFQAYDGINDGLLPTWRGKYSGTRSLPNQYGAGYGNGNDGDPGDGFSRYIGEGVFYLTGGGKLYQPEKTVLTTVKGTRLLSDCYGGKVLSVWNGTYYVQNVNGNDVNSVQILKENQYIDIGNGKVFRYGKYGHLMTENLFYHDHAYYDIEMNRAIEIEEYTSLQMDGSVFNEGFALIFLVGKDGNTYVTVINDEGTVQFEPIRAQRTSGKVSDGYFVVRTDTECAVYDINGDYVRHLCSAAEGEYFRDISGGYVTIFGVVNGKGMNRIYDLNPEWVR